MRLISGIVLSVFIYCFVLHEPLLGVSLLIKEQQSVNEIKEKFEDFNLPYRYGRISDWRPSANGSSRLIIYIQDLHCHPEVQKNIYQTIKLIDERYGINRIYIEGAPRGRVDSSALLAIPDSGREKILNSFLDKGLISGAEYYSVINNKDKLYGIEDWEVYKKNLNCIRKLFVAKEENEKTAAKLSEKLHLVSKKYLSKDIKRLLAKLKNKESEKRYFIIEKISKKVNEDLIGYPNLNKYIETLKLSKKINYKRLNHELSEYTGDLKKVVPFSVYQLLIKKLEPGAGQEEYYYNLKEIASVYTPAYSLKYPNLSNFLNYVSLNYRINPIYLTAEEDSFIKAALSKYSKSMADKELLFLAGMSQIFCSLASLKATPDNFEFFKQNKENFRIIIQKYLPGEDLRKAFALLDNNTLYEFFQTNEQRNNIFIENIVQGPSSPRTVKPEYDDKKSSISQLLSNSQIDIIIAGGFHSGITETFINNDISFITITPDVTKDYSETIYEKTLAGTLTPADVMRSAFSDAAKGVMLSGALGIDQVNNEVEVLITGLADIISREGGLSSPPVNKFIEEWKINLLKKSGNNVLAGALDTIKAEDTPGGIILKAGKRNFSINIKREVKELNAGLTEKSGAYDEILSNIYKPPKGQYLSPRMQQFIDDETRMPILNIVSGCDQGCLMCLYSATLQKNKYMPFSEIESSLDAIKKNGFNKVSFCLDFDVFSYHDEKQDKDIYDVLMAARERNLDCWLITHGWDTDDKIAQKAAEKIAKAGLKDLSIFVSFHTWHADFYSAKDDESKARMHKKYVDRFLNVINTLKGCHVEFRYIYDGMGYFPQMNGRQEAVWREVMEKSGLDADTERGNWPIEWPKGRAASLLKKEGINPDGNQWDEQGVPSKNFNNMFLVKSQEEIYLQSETFPLENPDMQTLFGALFNKGYKVEEIKTNIPEVYRYKIIPPSGEPHLQGLGLIIADAKGSVSTKLLFIMSGTFLFFVPYMMLKYCNTMFGSFDHSGHNFLAAEFNHPSNMEIRKISGIFKKMLEDKNGREYIELSLNKILSHGESKKRAEDIKKVIFSEKILKSEKIHKKVYPVTIMLDDGTEIKIAFKNILEEIESAESDNLYVEQMNKKGSEYVSSSGGMIKFKGRLFSIDKWIEGKSPEELGAEEILSNQQIQLQIIRTILGVWKDGEGLVPASVIHKDDLILPDSQRSNHGVLIDVDKVRYFSPTDTLVLIYEYFNFEDDEQWEMCAAETISALNQVLGEAEANKFIKEALREIHENSENSFHGLFNKSTYMKSFRRLLKSAHGEVKETIDGYLSGILKKCFSPKGTAEVFAFKLGGHEIDAKKFVSVDELVDITAGDAGADTTAFLDVSMPSDSGENIVMAVKVQVAKDNSGRPLMYIAPVDGQPLEGKAYGLAKKIVDEISLNAGSSALIDEFIRQSKNSVLKEIIEGGKNGRLFEEIFAGNNPSYIKIFRDLRKEYLSKIHTGKVRLFLDVNAASLTIPDAGSLAADAHDSDISRLIVKLGHSKLDVEHKRQVEEEFLKGNELILNVTGETENYIKEVISWKTGGIFIDESMMEYTDRELKDDPRPGAVMVRCSPEKIADALSRSFEPVVNVSGLDNRELADAASSGAAFYLNINGENRLQAQNIYNYLLKFKPNAIIIGLGVDASGSVVKLPAKAETGGKLGLNDIFLWAKNLNATGFESDADTKDSKLAAGRQKGRVTAEKLGLDKVLRRESALDDMFKPSDGRPIVWKTIGLIESGSFVEAEGSINEMDIDSGVKRMVISIMKSGGMNRYYSSGILQGMIGCMLSSKIAKGEDSPTLEDILIRLSATKGYRDILPSLVKGDGGLSELQPYLKLKAEGRLTPDEMLRKIDGLIKILIRPDANNESLSAALTLFMERIALTRSPIDESIQKASEIAIPAFYEALRRAG